MDLHDLLPATNYVIKEDPFGNLYLEQIEEFEIPSKLYGLISKQTERILRTFSERTSSTGVMLSGEKGSGKTLLAKNISGKAIELGIPTIVINAPWHGDKFNSFIQNISQPCIILFDEFEKVYADKDQQDILTLLDGVFPTKKLFILTCNDRWKVNTHMRNRPGRIYYMLDFDGLDDAFIEEYCNDNLINKVHTDRVCKIATVFDSFNFDMLKALIEEMNRFDETPQEALAMLNAKPEFSSPVAYDVEVSIGGKKLPEDKVHEKGLITNPLFSTFSIDYSHIPEGKKEEDEEYLSIILSPKDIKHINAKEGTYVFSKEGRVVTLKKIKHSKVDYYAF
jgi:hypothetical protein